ncbi:MAG: pyrroline-5-carboxylate reductase [Clostridiales bacterium]|nr:pyrroline-5-carboxylate reductase [Clostridiales bacterium]
MNYTLGFIGCGNMGGALAQAAAKSLPCQEIAVCDFDENKTQPFKKLGCAVTTARDIAQNAKFVVLAVKPQAMKNAIEEFSDLLSKRNDAVIITMAAGLSIRAIRSFIGGELPTVRIMPNTPVLLGEGMILYATDKVSSAQEALFLSAFSKAGVFDKIEESAIDAGSALSGCGPAFVYAFAKALQAGGESCGVPKEKAALYAAQTLRGAAAMLLQFGDPDQLIKNVCSPGGTTIEGIKSLEKDDLNGVTQAAVEAAYKRTLELKR